MTKRVLTAKRLFGAVIAASFVAALVLSTNTPPPLFNTDVAQAHSAFERDPAKDFDTLAAAGNDDPQGIHIDGTTVWVSDPIDDKLYAYDLSSKARVENRDISLHGANGGAAGVWSNGTTIWVADNVGRKIYAYNVSDGFHNASEDFDTLLSAGVIIPWGLFSDGTTMWVADFIGNKIYAFNLTSKQREPTKDFNTLSAAGNNEPRGIWSDGTTMWVSDEGDDKIYAYNVSTKARDSAKDFNTLSAASNYSPIGIFSDRKTMWVVDTVADKIYAYVAASAPDSDHTPTPTPTPTLTPTVDPIKKTLMASRIEPAVTSATVSAGDAIVLKVNIFGAQNLQDQALAEHHEYVWKQDGSTLEGSGAELIYTAPSSPGTYSVEASLTAKYCLGDADACTAKFEVVVRRSSPPPQATPEPVNPDGEIPSILTDGEGNQYEVFTPVEGGTFDNSDGYSITAEPGAVGDREYIGVRMEQAGSASNEGQTHQRYTLGGNLYNIAVVDAGGEAISNYRLNTPAKVCIPLPAELSEQISGLAILASNSDGSLTVLTSSVSLGSSGTSVCGNISQIPASVAVGKQGAPAPLPTPTPEPTPAAPETGATAPSNTNGILVWAIMLGLAITVAGGMLAMARHRRNEPPFAS